MGRLDVAAARFQSALDSLESLASPLALSRKLVFDAEARVSELEAERERLLARIAELEQEAQALSGLSGEVEERLDGAIAEIRTALGR